ncbi:hypothetical protein PMI40_01739 [Herbaspirillum sp. YR522]|nr:hypothetical protein PMI40_01739 [Herbaspirillum sp. YR522]
MQYGNVWLVLSCGITQGKQAVRTGVAAGAVPGA